MNLHDKFAPVVVRLLAKFGTDATLTRSVAQAAPTTSQKFSAAARTAHPLSTVIHTTAVLPDPVTTTDDTGRIITYQTAIMLAEPKKGDTLTIGDLNLVVGDVRTTRPQGQAIYYTAVVTS